MSDDDSHTARARKRLGVDPDGLTPEQRARIRFGDPDLSDIVDADALLKEITRLRAENDRLSRKLQLLKSAAATGQHPKLSYRKRGPAWLTVDKPGVIYAIALVPELAPFRIKVGFTQKSVGERLASFATACPTAKVIATWAAHPRDEEMVHAALPGRIGESEVFICGDAEALLAIVDEVLGA